MAKEARTVWRYPITEKAGLTFDLPIGAEFLTLTEAGNGTPSLYFLVDPTREKEKRRFSIVGTGWEPVEIDAKGYRGTFHMNSYGLVFHVFED